MDLFTRVYCISPQVEVNCSGDSPFDAATLNCDWMVIGDGVIYELKSVPTISSHPSLAPSTILTVAPSTPATKVAPSTFVTVSSAPSSIPSSGSTAAIAAFHLVYTGLCTIPNPTNPNGALIIDNGEGANNPCAQLCLCTSI